MKRSILYSVFCCIYLFACETYDFEIPTCELRTPPTSVVPFDWQIEEGNYFRYFIDEEAYSFKGEALQEYTIAGCPNDPTQCQNQVTVLKFDNTFEFNYVYPIHEDDWIDAVGNETNFLPYLQLREIENPSGQADFKVSDNCGRTIDVEENDPLSFQHKINAVIILRQIESRNNLGNDIITSFLEIEGEFQGSFEINGDIKVIRGDYRIHSQLSRRK